MWQATRQRHPPATWEHLPLVEAHRYAYAVKDLGVHREHLAAVRPDERAAPVPLHADVVLIERLFERSHEVTVVHRAAFPVEKNLRCSPLFGEETMAAEDGHHQQKPSWDQASASTNDGPENRNLSTISEVEHYPSTPEEGLTQQENPAASIIQEGLIFNLAKSIAVKSPDGTYHDTNASFFVPFPIQGTLTIGRSSSNAIILPIDQARVKKEKGQFTSTAHGLFYATSSGIRFVDTSATGTIHGDSDVVGSVPKGTPREQIPNYESVGPLKLGSTLSFGRDNEAPTTSGSPMPYDVLKFIVVDQVGSCGSGTHTKRKRSANEYDDDETTKTMQRGAKDAAGHRWTKL